jgi:hypothetical protein
MLFFPDQARLSNKENHERTDGPWEGSAISAVQQAIPVSCHTGVGGEAEVFVEAARGLLGLTIRLRSDADDPNKKEVRVVRGPPFKFETPWNEARAKDVAFPLTVKDTAVLPAQTLAFGAR